ncbi:DUF3383 family protein [uncultured Paraglaciecola sp.]|uniref:DUF3383 family protein n=1 Tax=uncultured Paraglaciecola sp. TaxID=1765024 RepID=UPI00261E6901|nr:DUF3383 family protein [uncultured Paraglaciecola sp.]
MTSVLPISNIINVTITNTPSGLSERNVNSLALFTTDTPSNAEAFGVYISPSQVAEQYGTNSDTAAMANAIFAQTPNIRTGTGRLVIIPLVASVSATSGDVTTADISANVTALKAISDGDIRVTIDGVNYDLTALDFTNSDDLEDIAAVIQAKLVNGTVTATATTIKITSKKVGDDADVTIAQLPSGSGTDLSTAARLNASAATATSGADASGETILEAIARMGGTVSFAGVITNLNMEDDVVEAVSDGIQSQDRIFLHHFASTTDIAGIATTLQQSGNTKTRSLLYTDGLEEANLFKAAYAGRAFSVNFSGSNTSQTLNLKQLTTITPDANISQTLYAAAETAGIDLYVSYQGVPSIYSTGGNDFFDNIYANLAIKFALETAGFNFLRQTNTKVPQTEAGMNGLKNAYAQVCERFVRNLSIAAGSWTSSETFGDPEIFKQNILDRGYYIYSLPITEQSAVEREARKAPLVQIAIKRAGAIHSSDVIALVND